MKLIGIEEKSLEVTVYKAKGFVPKQLASTFNRVAAISNHRNRYTHKKHINFQVSYIKSQGIAPGVKGSSVWYTPWQK